MMNTNHSEDNPNAFLVFRKFLNLFLFNTIRNPNFDHSKTVLISLPLLEYLTKTRGEKKIVKTIKGDKLFRKVTQKYIKSLDVDEKSTFFYCYIYEYYRPEIFLQEIFFPTIYKNENEVVMKSLALDKVHPYVQDFVNKHFIYLFDHTKNLNTKISKKKYEELCETFLKKHDYKSLFQNALQKPFKKITYESN